MSRVQEEVTGELLSRAGPYILSPRRKRAAQLDWLPGPHWAIPIG